MRRALRKPYLNLLSSPKPLFALIGEELEISVGGGVLHDHTKNHDTVLLFRPEFSFEVAETPRTPPPPQMYLFEQNIKQGRQCYVSVVCMVITNNLRPQVLPTLQNYYSTSRFQQEPEHFE